MLMTPFVLHAKPIPQTDDPTENDDEYHMDANVARYCDILTNIEELINVSIEMMEECFTILKKIRINIYNTYENCRIIFENKIKV